MKGRCVLEQIQIKNICSLKDTGLITLRPINVLVGNNSSGKSTFLRTFPLIKQSISKYTDGPILWAGDVDDYVDFGSFKETITNDKCSDSIELTFVFDRKRIDALFAPFSFSLPLLKRIEPCDEDNLLDTCYSLVIKSRGDSDIFLEQHCDYYFTYCSYYIQNQNKHHKPEKMRGLRGIYSLLVTCFAVLFVLSLFRIAYGLGRSESIVCLIHIACMYFALFLLYCHAYQENTKFWVRMVLGVYETCVDIDMRNITK